MHSVTTFTLGQVEWALWKWVTEAESTQARRSSIFRTRIRRLLELDRKRRRERDEVPAARFAFHDAPPHGSGIEVRYAPFNVFCLALGLDFLDLGFKQAEIVYLLRHLRHKLLQEFEAIRRNPPDLSQLIGADPGYGGPTYEERGQLYQDRRIYMLVTKVELTEIIPGRSKPRTLPLIEEPKFYPGVDKLRDELHDGSPYHYRKAVFVELSHTAVLVEQYLTEAPQIRRGPK